MPRLLLFFLVFLQLPAQASQIAVGLWSKNLLAWDVWEKDQQLTHRLLLHNQGARPIEVEIRLLRFKTVNNQFVTVPTHKVLHKVQLAPRQLLQLRYPKPGGNDYMEFFENGRRIGLLEINGTPPSAPALQAGFRFYSGTSANSGQLGYWLGFDALYGGPSRLGFYAPKRYPEQYQLVKITVGYDTLSRAPSNLDSLRTLDPAILRLDSASLQAVVPRPSLPPSALYAMLTLETQYLSTSYYYDEQKRRLPQKQTEGSARHFIPVFAKP